MSDQERPSTARLILSLILYGIGVLIFGASAALQLLAGGAHCVNVIRDRPRKRTQPMHGGGGEPEVQAMAGEDTEIEAGAGGEHVGIVVLDQITLDIGSRPVHDGEQRREIVARKVGIGHRDLPPWREVADRAYDLAH